MLQHQVQANAAIACITWATLQHAHTTGQESTQHGPYCNMHTQQVKNQHNRNVMSGVMTRYVCNLWLYLSQANSCVHWPIHANCRSKKRTAVGAAHVSRGHNTCGIAAYEPYVTLICTTTQSMMMRSVCCQHTTPLFSKHETASSKHNLR